MKYTKKQIKTALKEWIVEQRINPNDFQSDEIFYKKSATQQAKEIANDLTYRIKNGSKM